MAIYKSDKTIILASKSPRRQEFMKELSIPFVIKLKEVDESYPKNLKGKDIAMYISEKKASAFKEIKKDELLITSDTIVWVENEALGKPKDRAEAISMLKKLSNKWHEVITAFTIKSDKTTISDFSITKVYFHKLSMDEISYYVDNFHPFDKAGAYGIQEWIGLIGIKKIEGSYNNVVGLPVDLLFKRLQEF